MHRFVVVAMLAAAVVVGQQAAPRMTGSRAVAQLPEGELVESEPNFGWTLGEFSVSGDGAAQYSLPLWVPQGRGRSTPELALAYDSRGGNGPLGVGWSLSGLSSITWCARTLAQDGYTDAGHFDGTDPLCLDGNRLLPMAGGSEQVEYRTERDTFSRITGFGAADGVPDHFVVEAKDGLIMTFGQTSDARFQAFRLQPKPDPDEPEHPDFEVPNLVRESTTDRVTFAWALNRIEDRDGNATTMAYSETEGDQSSLWHAETRLESISYAPDRRVELGYEDRADEIDAFGGGVHTRTSQRLSTIRMFDGPEDDTAELLREYRLTYDDDFSITRRSLLLEIKECDGDGTCKLPLPMSYSQGDDGFEPLEPRRLERTPANYIRGLNTGDVNGDGLGDLFYQDNPRNDDDPFRTWVQFGTDNESGLGDPVLSPDLDGAVRAGLRPIDVDADGRTDVWADVEEEDEDLHRYTLFESDGSRFVEGPGSRVGVDHPIEFTFDDGAYLADLDGNGLPDFVESVDDDDSDDNFWTYRLNRGSSGANRFEAVQETNQDTVTGGGRQVVDTDGDGRAELLQQKTFPEISGYEGWGLDESGDFESGFTNVLNTSARRFGDGADLLDDNAPAGALFSDLNGDGLDDAVMLDRSEPSGRVTRWTLRAQINSGNGFGSPAQPDPPSWTYDVFDEGFLNEMLVADFNGDGRDEVAVVPIEGPRSEGRPDGSHVDVFEWRHDRFVKVWTIEDFQYDVLPIDVDANGAMDLVVGLTDDEDGVARVQVYRHQGGVPDQLRSIGLVGAGPVVEVDYTNLADRDVHIPCTGPVYPQICPSTGGTIVKEHRVATYALPGADQWDVYTHDYADARADLDGRGWLGFGRHTVTRQLSGAISSTVFDNVTRDPVLEVYPYANLPKTTGTFTPNGPAGAGSRITMTYDNVIRRTGQRFTVEQQGVTEVSEERPPGVNVWVNLRTRSIDTTFDAFGNRDLVRTATTGGRTITEDPTFSNDTTNWLIGLPTRTVTTGCDTADRCTARTTSFDHYPDGNLRLTVVEPDQPAFRLSTEIAYDTLGNVTTITRTGDAAEARVERFEYEDADRLHPTATVNAAGHRTEIETHSGLGVQLEVTDPNGVPATMRYDRFGRLREVNRADGSFERITHGSFFWQLTTTEFSGGGRTLTVVDQLDRERRRDARTFDGRMASVFTDYDARGRVQAISRPTFSSGAREDTVTAYDNLDRPTVITAPDDVVVRHEYRGLETHTFDGTGTPSYTVTNKDGDVAASFEDDPASTEWLETSFEYDGFGQTTKMTAPDDTAQVMGYDTLGRQDRLVDPSSGTTTMAYNAFGEMTTRTDATGATTTLTYDALGRVLTSSSPDGDAINTWDTAENGTGKLARAVSADGVTMAYRYTTVGKPASTSWTIDGVGYQVGYDYDLIGRQDRMVYPAIPGAPAGTGRLSVNYVYNANGYLERVRDSGAGPVYWQAEGRAADGQLTQERLGNGVVGTRSYEPATGLPTDIAATGPGTTGELSHVSLGYDDDRNVVRRADTVTGREEIYAYDPLNRLQTWTLTPPGQPATTTSYTYDDVGNMKTETNPDGTITYHHGENGFSPHALTGMGDDHVRFGYDAAGRQVTAVRRTVTYNQAGLPRTVTYGQNEIRRELIYDAAGARARKSDPGKTIVTVGGLFERLIRAPGGEPPPSDGAEIHNTHNIVVDGRIVAQVVKKQATPDGPILPGAGVHYLHGDAQDSIVLVSDGAGRSKVDLFYDPWGHRTTVTGARTSRNEGEPRQGYTGHEHDDDPGLINAKGRIYDPATRRFLTPDPVMADPRSSQAHNRYSYVRNNPTTLTDPSGLCTLECGWVEGIPPPVFVTLITLAQNPASELGAASKLLLSATSGCMCVVDGADGGDDDSGHEDQPEEPTEQVPGNEQSQLEPTVHTDPGVEPSSDTPDGPTSEPDGTSDMAPDPRDPWGAFGPAAWLTTAAVIGGTGGLMTAIFGKYTELTEITHILMGMRDLAVETALEMHELDPLSPLDFGNHVDYLWKTQIEKAIEDGMLPTNLEVVPRGAAGPDVWIQIGDTRFAVSWDSMSSAVRSVVQHDKDYIGQILYGRDDEWYLNLDVIPILHPGTKGGWRP